MRIAVALVFVVACKSTSGSTADGGATGRSITYDFNGSAFAGSTLATAMLVSNGGGGMNFGLEAGDVGDHVLAITVVPATETSTVTAGTYEVGANAPLAAFQFMNAGDGSWAAGAAAAGSGSIVFTTLTATAAQGTFSATMVGSGGDPGVGAGVITNGVFDLKVN
jgi:hypothetical protein